MIKNKHITSDKLVYLFLYGIFGVFPLYVRDYYFDLEKAKSVFFLAWTGIIIILLMIIGFYNFFTYKTSLETDSEQQSGRLSFMDYGMLGFVLCSIISWLLSSYKEEALFGQNGRYHGLAVILAYGIIYFIIRNFYVSEKRTLHVFFLSGNLVCLLGILNHYSVDPFGFYEGVDSSLHIAYLSTMGHMNVFTSFVSIILPLSIIFYCIGEKEIYRAFYFASAVIGYLALMIGNSDSGYLGLLCVFMILPFYLIKKRYYFSRYITMVIAFLVSTKIIGIMESLWKIRSKGLLSVSAFLVESPLAVILLPVLFLLLFWIHGTKGYNKNIKFQNTFKTIWLFLWIAGIILLVLMFILINVIGSSQVQSILPDIFILNDGWGNTRGYVWKRGIELFFEGSLKDKLIGYGPDTINLIMEKSYGYEMYAELGYSFDNLHNEYLQYLLTTGILGFASYLLLLFGTYYQGLKLAKENPLILALTVSFMSYCIQAMVNVNQPVTTPLFIVILSILGNLIRKEKDTFK